MLYQLSYDPEPIVELRLAIFNGLPIGIPKSSIAVGLGGIEPPTSRLSGVRSNQPELQPRVVLLLSGAGPGGAARAACWEAPQCGSGVFAKVVRQSKTGSTASPANSALTSALTNAELANAEPAGGKLIRVLFRR